MRQKRGLIACITVTIVFVLACTAIFAANRITPQSYEVLSERSIDPDIVSQPPSEEERVNINTADVAELCTIPGIGETRANAIIAYREENGKFLSTADIMLVEGIGEGIYESISEYITIGEEAE